MPQGAALQAYATNARPLALEVHKLLKDLDPARRRDAFESAARRQLVSIEQRLAHLVEQSTAFDGVGAIRERLAELAHLVREHTPAEGLPLPDLRAEWEAFRMRIQPAYEALAAALKTADVTVPSLRPTNYKRNAFHAGGAVIAIGLVEYVLTRTSMVLVAGALFSYAWSMEILRRRSGRLNALLMRAFSPFAHPHEAHKVNSATWYSTALLALAATSPVEVITVALAVLGFADPAAAIIGRRFGRVKLVNGRTLEGSLTFATVGSLAGLTALTVWHPELSVPLAVAAAMAGAALGSLAELFSRNVDDNLVVPLAAAAGSGLVLLLA